MAVVRELVTVLATQFDSKGVQQYESAIQRIKTTAAGLAGALGIAFGAEKIYEFVEGLIATGKEIGKIQRQIENVARPADDVAAAMERTYEIAQSIGVEYTKVADTFRDFLQDAQDSVLTQEELLTATSNLFKAMRVDRLDAEGEARLGAILQRIDVMGKASPRMIGMLQNTSMSTLRLLMDYFKTNEDGLRQLAKDGKITYDEIMKALSTGNAELEDRFSKLPWTLGRAWNVAYNAMAKGVASFVKETKISVLLGTALIYVTNKLIDGFKAFFDAIGGVRQATELLGITLAVVLGPRLLAQLAYLTAATLTWARASWRAMLPWTAAALAIAGVAIAIQDLVYWIQGKPNLIGTWVGPFEDLAENFKALDIFAGPRLLQDLVTGNWSAALKDFNTLLESTQAQLFVIIGLVTGIGIAFLGWRLLKFSGVIGGLNAIKNALTGVKAEAGAARAAIEGGAKPGAAARPAGAAEPFGPPTAPPTKFGGGQSSLGFALALSWPMEYLNKRLPKMNDAAAKQIDDFIANFSISQTWGGLVDWSSRFIKGKSEEGTPSKTPITDFNKGWGVTPGAIGPTSMNNSNNDNKQITFNQSNSVSVQVQDDAAIADSVTKRIADATREMFSGAARDLGRSNPRTEAAIG